MNRKTKTGVAASILILGAASCAAWAVNAGARLVMDGSTVSTDVRMVSGRPYVAVSDLAKAMDMSVVKEDNTYQLVRASGSTQARLMSGKIATDISSGSWSFKVISAEQVEAYSDQFGPDKDPVARQQAKDILIAVRCRLKNSSGATREVYFDKSYSGNTALTDHEEHAYIPAAIDSRNSSYTTNRMLPGAAHEFSLVFSVPNDTKMKDLVYTVGTSSDERKTDFRVELMP